MTAYENVLTVEPHFFANRCEYEVTSDHNGTRTFRVDARCLYGDFLILEGVSRYDSDDKTDRAQIELLLSQQFARKVSFA